MKIAVPDLKVGNRPRESCLTVVSRHELNSSSSEYDKYIHMETVCFKYDQPKAQQHSLCPPAVHEYVT